MQVSLPRFGNGMASVFDGSPMQVAPPSGKLKMAASNLNAAGQRVQSEIAQLKAQGAQDAKVLNSKVDIKA